MSHESRRRARIEQIKKDLEKELNRGRDVEYKEFILDVSANLGTSYRKTREYVDTAMRVMRLAKKKINDKELIRPQ